MRSAIEEGQQSLSTTVPVNDQAKNERKLVSAYTQRAAAFPLTLSGLMVWRRRPSPPSELA